MTGGSAATAAVLSVGDELVLGTTLDTNSRLVSLALRDAGYATVEHRTVADDLDAIVVAMRELTRHTALLVVTGGLGPTADDLTRDALNVLLDEGAPMLEDLERRTELRQWFEGRGRVMPAINARQVMRPRSARTLPNANGTAPGLAAEFQGAQLFCLPGPPSEMEPMLRTFVLPHVARAGLAPVVRLAVQTFGLGESQVAEILGNRMTRGREPAVGTTASQSIVTVQVVARGGGEPLQAARKEADECAALLAPYAFGGAEESLASGLLQACAQRATALAVAESCTAGLVGAAIASVPGSSEHFLGGWITYSNELKMKQLGVGADILAEHGAVSAECAAAMARGAAHRAGAGLAIAVTGIAGPDGATPGKPVGTVWIAVHRVGSGAAHATATRTRRFEFPGPRDVVRDRATKAALQMARWCALGMDAPMLWERA